MSDSDKETEDERVARLLPEAVEGFRQRTGRSPTAAERQAMAKHLRGGALGPLMWGGVALILGGAAWFFMRGGKPGGGKGRHRGGPAAESSSGAPGESSSAPAPESSSAPTTPAPAAHPAEVLAVVGPSRARFVPGAARYRRVVHRLRGWRLPVGSEHVIPVMLDGRQHVQVWHVGRDGRQMEARREPIIATPELLARAEADRARAERHEERREEHYHHRDRHMGGAGDADPHQPAAPASRAKFKPGAPRATPLVRQAHGHSYAPSTDVATRVGGGKYVQIWHVGADGVTMTANAEPLAATPELLARADADKAAAKPAASAPTAQPSPGPSGGASSAVSALGEIAKTIGGGGGGGGGGGAGDGLASVGGALSGALSALAS